MRTKIKCILIFMGLVAIDQGIKLLIYHYFLHSDQNLIGNLVRFSPIFNRKLSWLGHYISILSNYWFLMILTVFDYIIVIFGFHFYQWKAQRTGKLAVAIFLTGIAAMTCSLIDRVFWGGSLDYIELPHLFTFDLKDCYLTFVEVTIFILLLIHNKEIKFKDFLLYCSYLKKKHVAREKEASL